MPNASLNGEAVVDPSLHHQTLQSGESMINKDRISDLPDALLDQIYSGIDIIEAIRSSLVSKRWRYLWKSLTFLNADCHTYYHHQGIPAAEFNDFVNKVLLFRDSSSTIQRYCFKYEKKIPVTESEKTMIQFTVPSNTPVLDLEFCSNTLRTIHLCPCVATSKQLTVLKLKMRKGSHGYGSPIAIFSLPESLSLPRLKTLHLQMLRFQGTEFVHNLFSSCPVLEILTIIKCELHKTDNVIFSAVQLKHLDIDELSAYCDMESNKKCKITVSATNLRTFVCRADISNEYSLQNLSSLVKADIDMRFPFSNEFEELELSRFWNQGFGKEMMLILGGLGNAESLTVSALLLEVIPEAIGILPTPFSVLRQLKLKAWFSRNCIRGIKYLLENAINVEILRLEITRSMSSSTLGSSSIQTCCSKPVRYRYCRTTRHVRPSKLRKYWETDLLSAEINFRCLKLIEIHYVRGCANELEFLKFLLKNASILEKLTIFTSKERSPESEILLTSFSERLMAYLKASSNAEILFK